LKSSLIDAVLKIYYNIQIDSISIVCVKNSKNVIKQLFVSSPGYLGEEIFVSENHQRCWWFQKALAMGRQKYPPLV